MQIDIQTIGFSLTDSLKAYIHRRLARLSLEARSSTIRRIHVRLSDTNGRRGGQDKCCQIQLELNNANDIVIRDVQYQMYAAIDRATKRSKRMINREMRRRFTLRRLPRLNTQAVPAG